MSFFETLRTAFGAIFARKLRSALTMLGILIGIASVMLTVGLGQGAQKTITDEINKLGSNMIMVTSGANSGFTTGGANRAPRAVAPLTLNDAAALANKQANPDIAYVAPISQTAGSLAAGTTTASAAVVGTTPDWLPIRARTVTEGRFFTTDDSTRNAMVAVLGSTTATNLFGTGYPVGQTFSLNGQSFTVIGVLNTVGQSITGNEDDQVVIPAGTYAVRMATTTNLTNVSMILLSARDQASLTAAQQQATATMLNQHRVTAAAPDFSVSSQQALVNTIGNLTGVLTALLSGLAAISLIVGGIGVMNIMLVSVTERIREIGLRKALGATPSVIMQQFLVEASALGLMGGALGIGLGVVGANVITRIVNQPVIISPAATLLALTVSLVIGIVAGVYPAYRAARMAPIDALRNE
ncbi:MAG TPA: ABC transporter permease [Propionibacteriaceae bacterium]|nr:ABC transporter permease [Propionibacteriaceae bacterium]